MIKTAVIGASGFIGHHLINKYRLQYPDCIGTSFLNNKTNLLKFDIKNPNIEPLNLERTGHKAVIITAYKSNIFYCENEPSKAYEINVGGVLQLIKNLSKTSLKIIFLSSEYVFDGIQGNYNDDHPRNPKTVYGKHKKIIEDKIKNLTDNFLVLRLSKNYGLKKGDNTILDEAANLLSQRKEVLAAEDQYFNPTFIDDLVQAIINIQEKDLTGYINVCAPETWSRFEMHTQLAQIMNQDKKSIKKIKLYDIPEMKGRPLNTSMVCNRLKQETQSTFISLNDAMKKVASNYKNF
jgi:dTDP-4-dehydrorhamnose reductase